jgi:putative hemolysin
MKKTILAIAVVLVSFAIPYTTQANETPDTKSVVKEKVKKQFSEQFGTSADAEVYEVADGYMVKLTTDTKAVTAVYNRKGTWVHSIESFPGNALLKNVIDLVNENPENGFVTAMQKVTRPNTQPVFVIQTAGKDFLKTLRLAGNELETVANYKKG